MARTDPAVWPDDSNDKVSPVVRGFWRVQHSIEGHGPAPYPARSDHVQERMTTFTNSASRDGGAPQRNCRAAPERGTAPARGDLHRRKRRGYLGERASSNSPSSLGSGDIGTFGPRLLNSGERPAQALDPVGLMLAGEADAPGQRLAPAVRDPASMSVSSTRRSWSRSRVS
jgi:hypothetical protein